MTAYVQSDGSAAAVRKDGSSQRATHDRQPELSVRHLDESSRWL